MNVRQWAASLDISSESVIVANLKTSSPIFLSAAWPMRSAFAQAATGAVGVETLLPLSLEMYHNESLSLNKIIETLTINPAKILKIKKGSLSIGSDGDICIIDLEIPWMVQADNLKSKSKNTAIEGRKLQGKVLMTFLNGELVFNQ